MQFRLLHLFILFYYLCILIACANRGTLSGGERDITPPGINDENSTKNFQTNFKKQDIKIDFDEWVTVTDVFNQVVVSPPLEHKPIISVKKKTVIFEFDEKEVLKKDATYTINFGESVKDFTEGNVAPNLKYVFSTGDYLDSLRFSGKVVDGFTGSPKEGALVMLYDNLADSVVRTQRPFYFGKTNKSGKFQINNIKPGTFKVFALEDIDFNYLFNLDNEVIGYMDEFITLPDSTLVAPTITMYEETPVLNRIKIDTTSFGLVKLTFNQSADNILLETSPKLENSHYIIENDSIKFWYNSENSFDLLLSKDDFLDTIQMQPNNKDAFLKEVKLDVSDEMKKSKSLTINPGRPLTISFNQPILKVNNDSILLLEDSLQTEALTTFTINPLDKRELIMDYKWHETAPYNFTFKPNALEDIYGLINDSIQLNYNALPKRVFGNIILTVNGLNENYDHKIELLFRGTDVVETVIAKNVSTFNVTWNSMAAGDYSVQILEDRNQNGKWDPGNYDQKRQPEKRYLKALEKLRSNWDLEATVTPEF